MCQNLVEKVAHWFVAASRQCSMSSGTAVVLHISRHAVSPPSVCRHQHAKSKYPKLYYLLYLYVSKAFDIHIYFFNPLIINQEMYEQLCSWVRISETRILMKYIVFVLYKAQQPLNTWLGVVCVRVRVCVRMCVCAPLCFLIPGAEKVIAKLHQPQR